MEAGIIGLAIGEADSGNLFFRGEEERDQAAALDFGGDRKSRHIQDRGMTSASVTTWGETTFLIRLKGVTTMSGTWSVSW